MSNSNLTAPPSETAPLLEDDNIEPTLNNADVQDFPTQGGRRSRRHRRSRRSRRSRRHKRSRRSRRYRRH